MFFIHPYARASAIIVLLSRWNVACNFSTCTRVFWPLINASVRWDFYHCDVVFGNGNQPLVHSIKSANKLIGQRAMLVNSTLTHKKLFSRDS